MPRIPETRRQGAFPGISAPTGAGRAISTDPGAGQGLQQLGGQLGELAQRLRGQQLQEQRAQVETQARQQLVQLETEALNSPDFRQAPEQFQAQAAAVVSDLTEGVDPEIQAELEATLGRRVAISSAELRRKSVRKSQRNQVEAFQNSAQQIGQAVADAETVQGREEALASLDEQGDALAETGALLPAEAEGAKTEARQNALEARAQKLIADKRPADAITFLNNEERIPAQRKRVLLSLAESAQRQNNAEMNDIVRRTEQFALSRGRLPSEVSGVPFQDIRERAADTEAGQAIQRIESNLGAIQSHTQRPVREQVARLGQLRGSVSSPQENDTLQLLEQATAQAAKAGERQPFQFGEDHNVIGPVRDLDLQRLMQGPDDPEAANILNERTTQARALTEYFGRPISPLTPAETQQATQVVQNADAETGTRILSTVTGNLGFTQAQQLADALGNEDPVIGVAALQSPDAPEVSREILEGRKIEDSSVKLDRQDMRRVMDNVSGGALQASPASRAAFRDAALSIYRRRAISSGATENFDRDLFQQSVRLVLNGRPAADGTVQGGPVEVNGVQTLPPRAGVSGGRTRTAFTRMRNPDIAGVVAREFGNGLPGRINRDGELERADPTAMADASPVFVGRGRYMMRGPDGAFFQALDKESGQPTGQPMIVDLRSAMDSNIFRGEVSIGPLRSVVPGSSRPGVE